MCCCISIMPCVDERQFILCIEFETIKNTLWQPNKQKWWSHTKSRRLTFYGSESILWEWIWNLAQHTHTHHHIQPHENNTLSIYVFHQINRLLFIDNGTKIVHFIFDICTHAICAPICCAHLNSIDSLNMMCACACTVAEMATASTQKALRSLSK